MKKLIGAIAGCVAAYYVIDVLAAVSMACAWGRFGRIRPHAGGT